MKCKGLLLVVMLSLFAVPAFSAGEVGEYVSVAAKGLSKKMPPGQFAHVAQAADQFLSTAPGGNRTIYAEMLMDGIDDPELADELGDYFLLDIRPATDFCKGTVPGAINIPMPDLAKAENLAKLPKDKPILVICNTGHTASISNAVLGVLGYDAWTLRFGMTSWNGLSKTKIWSPKISQDLFGAGYPTQTCQ